MKTRFLPVLCLTLLLCVPLQPAAAAPALTAVVRDARALAPLEALIVAREGKILVEEGFRGHSTRQPTNIKSGSLRSR